MLIHVTGLSKAIDRRDKGATANLFDDAAAGVKPKPSALPSKIRVQLSPVNRVNVSSSESSNNSHPHVEAGQTQVNPETGKTIKGGQFAPKHGTDEPGKSAEKSSVGPITLNSHLDFLKRLFAGNATSDELQQHADAYIGAADAVKSDLSKKTVPELMKLAGGYIHDKKKASLVDQVYRDGLQRLALGKTISYQLFGGDSYEKAARKVVAGVTNDDIRQFAEERAERIASRKRALTDPQTYADFETFIHFRGEKALTLEQRVKWDGLQAEHNRGIGILPPKPTVVEKVDTGGAGISVKDAVHTKSGYPIFIAQLSERVDREKYQELNAKAKQLGGYYSSFGPKENHGFIFKSREAADKFAGLQHGDVDKADIEQAKKEEKGNATAARLRGLADRMRDKAEESLGRERQTNTHRRATMAAGAEADARRSIAMANTLQNIADAIETGEVKHLSGLTSRAQVETLNGALTRAHWNNVKTKRAAGEIGRMAQAEDIPLDMSDIDHAEFPFPYIHRSTLRDAARELQAITGKKRLASRIEDIATTIGDGDRLTSEDKIRSLQDAAGVLNGGRKYGAGERLKSSLEDYDRLHRMGIKDLPSLRAALREYLPMRSESERPDPIKEKERALIGRKIAGYFPTPRGLSREIVADADIRPGMKVLEPNGGKGNIADAVREEHPDADLSTVEPVQDLRDILTAKGHKLVGHDFLEHHEKYDRIVMNPPFENRQDVDHVRHAYDLLKPGGKLVAIMSEGPFGGASRKDEEFRDWLMSHGGRSEKLPDGSFSGAQAERQTGVSTRKVIIDKPMEEPMSKSMPIVVVGLSKAADEDRCHKCGKAAGKWQYFCRPCLADTEHQQLDELGVCPRCGIKYSDDCSHCERCGYKPGDKRPKYRGISKAVILGLSKATDGRDAWTGDLFGNTAGPSQYARCRICGRKLRDDVSRRRGIGPECWEKIGHHAATIKRMPHPSKDQGTGNLSMDFDKKPESDPEPSAPVISEDAYLREKYGTRPTASTGRYLDRKHLQDLRDQIERKQAQLDRLNGQQQRNGDLPGTFVTGRSGVSASYSKKLNRQLDRTIDTAVDIVALTKEIPELRRRLELYEAGRINEQGRSIDSPAKLKKQIAGAEAILASGLLKGKPLTAEERSITRDILKSAKEKLKRIKPEDYAPEAGADSIPSSEVAVLPVEKSLLGDVIVRGLKAAGKKMAKLGTASPSTPSTSAGKVSETAPIHDIHAPVKSAMQSHKFTWHQVAHRTEKGPSGEYGHFSHLLSHQNPGTAMEKMRTHLQGLGHNVGELRRTRVTQDGVSKHVYSFQSHHDGQMHTFTAAKMDGPVSKSVTDEVDWKKVADHLARKHGIQSHHRIEGFASHWILPDGRMTKDVKDHAESIEHFPIRGGLVPQALKHGFVRVAGEGKSRAGVHEVAIEHDDNITPDAARRAVHVAGEAGNVLHEANGAYGEGLDDFLEHPTIKRLVKSVGGDPFGEHLSDLGFKNHLFSREGDTFTHTMGHPHPAASALDLADTLKSRGHQVDTRGLETESARSMRPGRGSTARIGFTSRYKGITHHWDITRTQGNRPGGPLRERPELPIGKEPKMMAKAIVVVMNRRQCSRCGRPSEGRECYRCLGKVLVGG